MDMNPVTLNEWKAAVQKAYYTHQVVKEAKKAVLRNATQTTVTVSRPFHSNASSAVARLQQVEASSVLFSDSDEEEEDEEEEVVPGEPTADRRGEEGKCRDQDGS